MDNNKSSNLVIRQAKLYDVPFISRVERENFDTPRSADAITKDVTEGGPGIYTAVAELGSEKIGYADMRIVASEAQIYNISISYDFRAQGFGEMLMTHLIDKAREMGCDIITLEVSSSNEAGIALYKKMGFEEVGRRKGYYGRNKSDAILMDKPLAQLEINVSL